MNIVGWFLTVVFVIAGLGLLASALHWRSYGQGYSAAMREVHDDLLRSREELTAIRADYRKIRGTYDRILAEYRQSKGTTPPSGEGSN